jgi:hypothetical protein
MEQFLKSLDIPFTFTPRPAPVPGDLRPIWRVSLILLILLNSRGKKASLQKLHVMNWSARSRFNSDLLLHYMEKKVSKEEVVPRIEPSLNRAIDFAKGEGLVAVENGKNLILTTVGTLTAEEIDRHADCMTKEKSFLKKLKSFANEQNIEELLTWNQIV